MTAPQSLVILTPDNCRRCGQPTVKVTTGKHNFHARPIRSMINGRLKQIVLYPHHCSDPPGPTGLDLVALE